MYNIKTLNKISKIGLSELDSAKYSVSDTQEDPVGILVRSADMNSMELPEGLLAIARAGAGTNNIPCDACAEKGIVVFNTPGANANAVKELVICALMLASRDVKTAIEWASQLDEANGDVAKQAEKGKSQFVGPEILGKTLGVIGLGAIGVLVANAAVALGMKVIGCDPYLSVNNALHLDRSVEVADQKSVLARADYVTIHSPLLPDTKNMINSGTIAQMKDGVRIINMARGGLVSTPDMLAAVESGKVARYVTDFIDKDLLNKKNVVALPHLGASTPESEDNCAVMAARQMADYLEHGNITNSVNMPSVHLDPTPGATRLCVIHKNVPNVISTVTSALSSSNVENMVNKSRGDIAVTMLDVSAAIPAETLAKITANTDVIRIRVI